MLVCRPTAEHNQRADIVNIPITSLPDSALGLVWRRGEETQALKAFAQYLS